MGRKLVTISVGMQLKNVIFLGNSSLSNVTFKRVMFADLTEKERERVVTTEVCPNRNSNDNKVRCACITPCVYAVVQMTREEQRAKMRKATLDFWPVSCR